MAEVVLLDAGPLGMISHPRAKGDIVAWLATLVTAGVDVLIPEIADYEVRRELLRAGRKKGVARLDELKATARLCAHQFRGDVASSGFLGGSAAARPANRW